MRELLSMIGRELQWHRPSILKRTYELRAGNIVVAEMKITGAFRGTATAVTAEGVREFQRTRFAQSAIIVREDAARTEVATVSENRFKRTLLISLPENTKYGVASNFFVTKFTLSRANEESLADLGVRGLFRRVWYCEIRYRAKSCPHLPWLVPLMWYHSLVRRGRSRAYG